MLEYFDSGPANSGPVLVMIHGGFQTGWKRLIMTVQGGALALGPMRAPQGGVVPAWLPDDDRRGRPCRKMWATQRNEVLWMNR